MLSKINNQRGVSLMELILTMMILSIGFTGTMLLLQNLALSSVSTDMNLVASNLAIEKMENILADKEFQGYDQITNENYPEETLDQPYSGYNRSVYVTEVSSNDLTTPEPGSGLKKVDITVSWDSDVGDDDEGQTITVSTLLTNYSS